MCMFVFNRAGVGLFLALLATQLTGLSCLDDWTMESQNVVGQAIFSYISDDCPCHYAFISSDPATVCGSNRVIKVAMSHPMMDAFHAQFLLYRPPDLA